MERSDSESRTLNPKLSRKWFIFVTMIRSGPSTMTKLPSSPSPTLTKCPVSWWVLTRKQASIERFVLGLHERGNYQKGEYRECRRSLQIRPLLQERGPQAVVLPLHHSEFRRHRQNRRFQFPRFRTLQTHPRRTSKTKSNCLNFSFSSKLNLNSCSNMNESIIF